MDRIDWECNNPFGVSLSLYMRRAPVLFLLILAGQTAYSQCGSLDFDSPASACIGTGFQITPTTGFSTYDWDFCAGDLQATPAASILFNANAVGSSHKIDMHEQGGAYYGFFLGRGARKLYRLDFGTSVENNPLLVDLGGLGLNSDSWRSIAIVKEGANFFGFIVDADKLYRINFGSSLTSAPSNAQLLFTGNPINTAFELVAIHDQTSKYLFIAGPGDNGLVRIKFALSFADPVDPMLVDEITVTGSGAFGGVSFAKDCNVWYAVTTSVANSAIAKISFDDGLDDDTPGITILSGLGFTPSVPAGVALVHDNGHFFAFAQTQNPNSDLYRIDFGSTLTNNSPSGANLGNLGVLQGVWAFSMYRFNSRWAVFSAENSGTRIYRTSFPNSCLTNLGSSTTEKPFVTATTTGASNISLQVTNPSGGTVSLAKPFTVSASQAPDIDFTSQNVCAQHDVNFNGINVSGNVVTYSWKFGDSGTATGQTAAHTYTSAGNYNVSLDALASNGCHNSVIKPLQIFNEPVAAFTLPSASPVCTNQPYTFVNTSVFDAPSGTTWEWRVDGTPVATTLDLVQTFTTATPKSIMLTAAIPGCSSDDTQVIASLETGPLVDFLVNDNCEDALMTFNNMTSGTVTGYVWDFGDASGSTQTNPTHAYATAGTFQAKLTANNAQGCQNFRTKPVRVYSLPQPDFSVNLPPFSCANSPTPFQNNTPPLADSNITGWGWTFGDSGGGTSGQQNPSYTYSLAGDYQVTLNAVTDKGCMNSFAKLVSISVSPVADFTFGPSCLGEATLFTDLSSGAQSRQWQIATGSFTTVNPTYVFSSAGNFPASLTVTAANGCSNVKARTVSVPVPAVVNFKTDNLCVAKISVFTDLTNSPLDPVTGWNWIFDSNSVAGNPAEYIFTQTGGHSAKLTTTHASGCKYSLTKNITINPSPTAAFTALPDRGAAPLTVLFQNVSQNAIAYSWKFYDKVPASSTQGSPVYTFATLGDYSAELTAMNDLGCKDVLSVPITVLVPAIDLIMTDLTLTIDPGTGKLRPSVVIFNNSNVPAYSAEIELFLADKAVVNETLVFALDPGQSASRLLSFTLSSTQFDFSFLCAEIVSEKDVQPDNNKRCIGLETGDYVFAPYPNPSSGSVQIDWVSSAAGTARIIVYDSRGSKLYEWETVSEAGLNQTVHDLSFLAAGLYFISLETSGGRRTMRLQRQ